MSGSVLNTLGRTIFQLGFQISPIILNNGIAGSGGGAMLPIVAITEGLALINSLLTNGGASAATSLDDYFAHFKPSSGGTLIDFQIGEYPFANLTVAANAIISQPLRISMQMDIPLQATGAYATKLLTMMVLQKTIQQHCLLGGTFTVVTPAFIYTNMLLTAIRDISSNDGPVVQKTFQWDFTQPLITLQQAAAAQSSQMSQITNQTPQQVGATPTWQAPASSPGSAPGVAPGSQNLTGTTVPGFTPAPITPVTASPLPNLPGSQIGDQSLPTPSVQGH